MSDSNYVTEKVNQLTHAARGSWLSLLGLLSFVGVTLIGVQDADFFVPGRDTELPLIGVSVPTERFFAFAPLLIAALYSNFHFQLLKLWDSLSPRQAVAFEGTRHFSDRVNPSLIVDMALSLRKDQSVRYRPLRWSTTVLTFLLVFAGAPLVLAGLWWRSMPKHDEALTILFCGIPFLFALNVGFYSFVYLWRIAREKDKHMRPTYIRVLMSWTVVVAVSVWGWLSTEGTLEQYKSRDYNSTRLNALARNWIPDFGTERFLRPAKLNGVNFSEVPKDWSDRDSYLSDRLESWCATQGLTMVICEASAPTQGTQAMKRFEFDNWCERHSLSRYRAECEAEYLFLLNDAKSKWRQRRIAEGHRLSRASLANADLRGANLNGSNLLYVDLTGARLEGADISNANLEGADLSGATIHDANFSDSNLSGTIWHNALAERVILARADLRASNLRRANFRVAIFLATRLDEHTSFRGSSLDGAFFMCVDLSLTNITQRQVKRVFTVDPIELPKGFGRGRGESSYDADYFEEMEEEWRNFVEDFGLPVPKTSLPGTISLRNDRRFENSTLPRICV